MIVPYTELNDLGGGTPRPLLDIAVGSADDIVVPALVDSGAVNTLLPLWVAEIAGVDLDGDSAELRVGGGSVTARFCVVDLACGEFRWEAEVGFCDPWPYSWGLLGHTAFFRYFTVTFRAADFEFEVQPNKQ